MKHTKSPWFKILYRNLSSRRTGKKSHYDNLDISSKSTHNEIKSAYFKLSKQYHPDMNSSESAKMKFNEISLAYEVLGNHDKRKQYDRGLQILPVINHDEPGISMRKKTDFPDIAEEAKRAHSAIRNHSQPDGKPIFNFDIWTEAHYGKLFQRRQRDLSKYKSYLDERNETKYRDKTRNETMVFIMFTLMICSILTFTANYGNNMDNPYIIPIIKTEENSENIRESKS